LPTRNHAAGFLRDTSAVEIRHCVLTQAGNLPQITARPKVSLKTAFRLGAELYHNWNTMVTIFAIIYFLAEEVFANDGSLGAELPF
jgi:hypothetical protein